MLSTTDKLLGVLYSRFRGGCPYVSVDELAQSTDAAAEKIYTEIENLRRRGFNIAHTPSAGYFLSEPPRMDKNLLLGGLQTHLIATDALCFDAVGSTNDIVMDGACVNKKGGLVVTAESQNSGRGTRGRVWQAKPGSSILASCSLVDESFRINREPITIAAGLAVAQGIENACAISTTIKWPNDVYVNNSKIAGILLETKNIDSKTTALVIGVGINVTDCPPPSETRRPATCISRHSNQSDRIAILRSVLQSLDRWIAAVMKNDFDQLRAEWKHKCRMLNERITVNCASQIVTGRVVDIDPLEGLILACDDGGHVALKAEFSTIV